ncbi:MAG: CHASE2 domain-containing protein, partial [Anaerolineae bacterium]|nr:CHASE2 domain-containing protein [Anaerolineae bacterium]
MQRILNISPFVRRGLLSGAIVGLLLTAGYGFGFFQGLRLRASDTLFVGTDVSDAVILIAIDDASLSAYGRTPAEWSRALHATAIERLAAAGARVIAYELLMPEPTTDDRAVRDAIVTARNSDARTRFVFASAGIGVPRAAITDAGIRAIEFQTQLAPVQTLADVIDYVGGVSLLADADGIVRHQPSFAIVDSKLYPSFSAAGYLAYLRIPTADYEQVLEADGDHLFITEGRELTVDDYGQWLQDFANTPGQGSSTISFRDIIDGSANLDVVRDKVVVVGLLDATGVVDTYLTPVTLSGREMAGVEIQAHAIDSLIRNVVRTPQSSTSIIAMILALSFGSALVYEHLRSFWKPAVMIGLALAFAVAVSYVFAKDHVIVDVFDGLLALVAPGIFSVGMAVRRQYNRRRNAELTALNVNREKERLEQLLVGLPVSVAILDKDGVALRINAAFEALLSPLAAHSPWTHLAQRLEQSGLD